MGRIENFRSGDPEQKGEACPELVPAGGDTAANSLSLLRWFELQSLDDVQNVSHN